MNKKYEINIKGMTCQMCVDHVVEALNSDELISSVKIASWKEGKAIVTSQEGGELNKKNLNAILKKTSYKVKKVSTIENEAEQHSEPDTDIDLAIIGTGGAGMAAAIKAVSLGKKVTIIEKNDLVGGTCVNIGCIPSKALIKAANHNHKASDNKFAGIELTSKEVDWPKLVSQRKTLVNNLRKEKYENILKNNPQVTLIKAKAHFEKNNEGQPILMLDNGETILAKKYLIATGGRNFMPKIKGQDDIELLDSTSALVLTKKPESMIVLGGGFIALEIGQAFSRLGVKVKSIEVRSRLLSKWDNDLSKTITSTLAQEGIEVNEVSVPIEFLNNGNQKGVRLQGASGHIREAFADEILIAMGRQANSDDLHLEQLGITTLDDGSIVVDEFMQTSHAQIYAAGDVASVPKLVYVAAKTGIIAATSAFSESKAFDKSIVPEVVFCDPQIARVGLSEEEAKAKGLNVIVSKLELKHVPKALVSNNVNGFIKLVADSDKDTLIGAHIISENAGELIETCALAINTGKKYGFSIDDFKDMLFPYLTEGEALKLAAQTFKADVATLSCCAG